jgi:hypothetical protein
MSPDKIIVTVIGVFLILFISWFFFGNDKPQEDHEHNH